MTRAEPLRTADAAQHCCAIVRIATVDTMTRRRRLAEAARQGLPPEVCARPSTWIVDGKPLCLIHGGIAALRILAAETSEVTA